MSSYCLSYTVNITPKSIQPLKYNLASVCGIHTASFCQSAHTEQIYYVNTHTVFCALTMSSPTHIHQTQNSRDWGGTIDLT